MGAVYKAEDHQTGKYRCDQQKIFHDAWLGGAFESGRLRGERIRCTGTSRRPLLASVLIWGSFSGDSMSGSIH